MHPLKKIGVALFVIVIVVSGFALTMPPSTDVSRFIVIDSDIETVFSMVNNHREFNKWSPWARYDPETRFEFSGPESGVGAKMSWLSKDSRVGRGSREIIASIPNERVDLILRFDRQDVLVQFFLVQQNVGTRLTWSFHIEHGGNLISRFFGPVLDSWMDSDYEAGLENLKVLLENESDH